MGLTIHYSIAAAKNWSPKTIRAKLEALRQCCLDLPVEQVSELQEFKGKDCEPGEEKDDPFRWAKIQAARSPESPWQPGTSFRQQPSRMLVFSVWPAQGCEEMNIGVSSFHRFVCPKRKEYPVQTWADEQCNKPGWSLAITHPRSYPGAARILKDFAKRWKLRRMTG
ncbi:MAG: hypothetical protein ABSF26_21435 [Thermoguttaceae bacterium]|jgi:hypothetical protein